MIKIKSIQFINDEIFGSQTIDFTINGKPASTIVIAGKNGVGKTKLLSFVYQVCNQTLFTNSHTGSLYATIALSLENEGAYFENRIIDSAKIHCKKDNNGNSSYQVEYYSEDKMIKTPLVKVNGEETYYNLNAKSLFSTVDINYNPNRAVSTVSNRSLDNEDTSIPTDLASEIIQLLVDVKNQDNNDLAEYMDEHKTIPESKRNIRTKRFNTAFYHIFHNSLKFKGLENNTMPIFQKNSKRIKITDLSSGEKQIVFRGIYLLRNKESLNGIPVLIDEPEISMHPKWNENIYDYYRRLFKTDKGLKTSQMFMATHSEYVIENALKDDDCIIIKLDTRKNTRYGNLINNSIMNTSTSAEIKYQIFDILTIDYHIQLYSYIQNNFVGEYSTIKNVDDYLINNSADTKYYSYIDRNGNLCEYNSLPTYIRNCIDHPDNTHSYTSNELEKSIKYMIDLIKTNNSQ